MVRRWTSLPLEDLLGASWVVVGGVIGLLIWVILAATLLITPILTTHEPPSRGLDLLLRVSQGSL